jgi:hypothetical protein
MNPVKQGAIGIGVGVGACVLLVYLAKKSLANAASGALDALTGAAGAVGGAIEDTASAGWNTATTPVLDPSLPGASIGNGIVGAPSSILDSTSLGLISGDGGNTGNGGLWAWMTSIVSGDYFAPKGVPGIDLGTGDNNWND